MPLPTWEEIGGRETLVGNPCITKHSTLAAWSHRTLMTQPQATGRTPHRGGDGDGRGRARWGGP